MKGFEGYETYMKGCLFWGGGTVRGELYHLSDGYPIILQGGGEIHGEVYSVNEQVLKRIREYEGVAEANPLYAEEQVKVSFYGGELSCDATIFSASAAYSEHIRQTAVCIPSGKWREFIRLKHN